MTEEATTTPPAEPETTTPPAGETTPPPPAAGERTLTQEQFDKELGRRLHAERQRYADYDELKAKAAKLDQLEAEQQSDLEREQQAREEAERKAAEATARASDMLRRAAIVAEASKQGAQDPDAVVALLRERDFKVAAGDDDEFSVAISDDGKVTGVEETVKALLDDKKYLAGGETPPAERTELHQGTRQEAVEPTEEEQYQAYMKANFPAQAPDPATTT